MGGPVPKRSDQRRRQNKPEVPITEAAAGDAAKAPAAKKEWHPIAKRWYGALAKSGQSAFYEAADWETAYLLAESISRELKPQVVGNTIEGVPVMAEVPPRGTAMAAWRQTMAALLVTEGDRRRAHLELQRSAPAGKDAGGVDQLDEYRRRLQSG